MIRGTTPTLYFDLPFESNTIEVLYITFNQSDVTVLEKTNSDVGVTLNDKTITVHLTQEDTLKLNGRTNTEIQLRIKTVDGEALASNIISTPTERVLKDGEI